jgi:spore coat polysaccharide biosynthesis predicted glycosyltransferase SpsG
VIGPGVADKEALRQSVEALGCRAHMAPRSIAGLMVKADLAITTGGNTVFEFAALGTPAITLCVRRRQDGNAEYFQQLGAVRNLRLGDAVTEADLAVEIVTLAADRAKRQAMSEAGRRAVDGRGLERVVDAVLDAARS